jgi:hypothetical protein
VTRPGFFIVGAPKCGTSSLYRYLQGHPQVFLCTPKEPHHFNTDSNERYVRDRAAYEALFADAPAQARAVGEASVRYLWSTDAAANILAYQPDARFVVMLRNPVEMAPSVHQQELFNQNETEADFATAWALNEQRWRGERVPRHCADPRMLHYGFVCSNGAHLERLFATVGRERVVVVLLEDLRRDPAAQFARVVAFLGLDRWEPAEFAVVNAAKARRSGLVRRAVLEAANLKKKLGIGLSFGLLRRANRWNRKDAPRAPLPAAVRRELAAWFDTDIRKLESLLGRDLSHWRQVGDDGADESKRIPGGEATP